MYQAQLRDRLNLTQFSVDEAPMAILWIRPDGTLSEANDTACTLLGYTRAELLALPAIGRLDPNMIPRVWDAHWEKVRRERRFSILTEYRTKDGTLIPVEVTANYLRYDGEVQLRLCPGCQRASGCTEGGGALYRAAAHGSRDC